MLAVRPPAVHSCCWSLSDGTRMQALNLKVPPPIVALLVAAAMWGVSGLSAQVDVDPTARIAVALLLAAIGVVISVSGVLAFRAARTTANPLKPELATALVTGGVFRFTRNPMYLGLSVALAAWAVFLASPLALLGPIVFVAYINRFQVLPEERAMATLFGNAYAHYRENVRRWI